MLSAARAFCGPVALVARVGLLQTLRSRLYTVALFVALACVGAGWALRQASVFAHARLLLDFGLTALSVVGTLTVASLALGASHEEAAWMWLTKPIGKRALWWGQYLATVATMAAFVAVNGAGIALGVALLGTRPDGGLAAALLASVVELSVTAALAYAFAGLSSRPLAACLLAATWLCGQGAEELRVAAQRLHGAAAILAQAAFVGLPDYPRLSLRPWAAAQMPVEATLLASSCGYGVLYALCVAMLASHAFARKR